MQKSPGALALTLRSNGVMLSVEPEVPVETFGTWTCPLCAVSLAHALFLSQAWLAGVGARR